MDREMDRGSIDTLVSRLGGLAVDSGPKPVAAAAGAGGGRGRSQPTNTATRKPVFGAEGERQARKPAPSGRRKRAGPSFLSMLCFAPSSRDGGDYLEIRRHRGPRLSEKGGRGPAVVAVPAGRRRSVQPVQRLTVQQPSIQKQPVQRPTVQQPVQQLPRPGALADRRTESRTQQLLAYIPPALSPKTTAALLAELDKPVSKSDEPGYIYVFWLCSPDTNEATMRATGSVLTDTVADDDGRAGAGAGAEPRTRATADGFNVNVKSPLMLKIGRASNVHRRMNEWSRQCSYQLSLLRFYPHARPQLQQSRSAGAPRPADAVAAPVACSHRVERLIHIELADRQVKRRCSTCCQQHREWFETPATTDGLRSVDSVIKWWVEWSQSEASTSS